MLKFHLQLLPFRYLYHTQSQATIWKIKVRYHWANSKGTSPKPFRINPLRWNFYGSSGLLWGWHRCWIQHRHLRRQIHAGILWTYGKPVFPIGIVDCIAMARIYVQTNCGSIYYGIRNNLWGVKDIDINMLDITWLESEAYHITGSASQTKFSKFRGDLSVWYLT